MNNERMCYCENSHCRVDHIVSDETFEGCTRRATRRCDYIGWICNECATFMPSEYLGAFLEIETDNPQPTT